MAEKKKEAKIVLERAFNVPLRKEYLKAPHYKRTPKAVRALKEFLIRHMKSDKISIGQYANLKLWQHGIREPPHHIRIVAKKDESGMVFAELEGAPVEAPVEPEMKAGKAPAKEKKEVPADFKKIEEKVEQVKEEKAEQAKEIQKEEIQEMKKETKKAHAPKQPKMPKEATFHPSAPQGRGEMHKP